jgi:hypothetical protein
MPAEVIWVHQNHLPARGLAAAVTVLIAACSGGTPQVSPSTGHVSSPRPGWALPSTYRQACAAEARAFGCTHVPAGPIPAALRRPPHFPVLRAGQRCPASPGTPVNNSIFQGIARGTGPVRVLVGGTRRGTADLINPSSAPPWLALKTLWFSLPAYQGPFVIRARRLGRPGPVALGEGPVAAPLVVPPGPTLNSGLGYRTVPGGLFVKTPGCYAWQVDGLTFSEIIVIRAVLPKGPG